MTLASRRYPPPLIGADWTLSAHEKAAVALSLALSRHVPGWPGATDEQLGAVADDIMRALDEPWMEWKPSDMNPRPTE